jgi:hypothetical protein
MRNSKGFSINTEGRRVIKFCGGNSLTILNGSHEFDA